MATFCLGSVASPCSARLERKVKHSSFKSIFIKIARYRRNLCFLFLSLSQTVHITAIEGFIKNVFLSL